MSSNIEQMHEDILYGQDEAAVFFDSRSSEIPYNEIAIQPNDIDYDTVDGLLDKINILEPLDEKWLQLDNSTDLTKLNSLMRAIQELDEDTYVFTVSKQELMSVCNDAIDRYNTKFENDFAPKPNFKYNNSIYKKFDYGSMAFFAKAACKEMGADLFFPTYGARVTSTSTTIDICNRCEVKEECGNFAIKNDEKGIWGGMTERERRIKTRQSRKDVI